jgi:hypothetical protein
MATLLNAGINEIPMRRTWGRGPFLARGGRLANPAPKLPHLVKQSRLVDTAVDAVYPKQLVTHTDIINKSGRRRPPILRRAEYERLNAVTDNTIRSVPTPWSQWAGRGAKSTKNRLVAQGTYRNATGGHIAPIIDSQIMSNYYTSNVHYTSDRARLFTRYDTDARGLGFAEKRVQRNLIKARTRLAKKTAAEHWASSQATAKIESTARAAAAGRAGSTMSKAIRAAGTPSFSRTIVSELLGVGKKAAGGALSGVAAFSNPWVGGGLIAAGLAAGIAGGIFAGLSGSRPQRQSPAGYATQSMGAGYPTFFAASGPLSSTNLSTNGLTQALYQTRHKQH